jgi:hypothetical protein
MYRFHLQAQFVGLLFDPEDGGDVLPNYHGATSHKTVVKTVNAADLLQCCTISRKLDQTQMSAAKR